MKVIILWFGIREELSIK